MFLLSEKVLIYLYLYRMNKKGDCIRNRTNFTVPKTYHMIDKKDFNPDMLNVYINNDASPKLKLLLEQIFIMEF